LLCFALLCFALLCFALLCFATQSAPHISRPRASPPARFWCQEPLCSHHCDRHPPPSPSRPPFARCIPGAVHWVLIAPGVCVCLFFAPLAICLLHRHTSPPTRLTDPSHRSDPSHRPQDSHTLAQPRIGSNRLHFA
jgi:hypothetical protein